MNLFEILGVSYVLGLILSISIIIGFFVIVSKVSAIARDTETIKNKLLNDAEKRGKELIRNNSNQ
jgi:hypothetical protein